MIILYGQRITRERHYFHAVDSVTFCFFGCSLGRYRCCFFLPLVVASRVEYEFLPPVPTESLLGFCHCWGMQNREWVSSGGCGLQPMVCKSKMTCGLLCWQLLIFLPLPRAESYCRILTTPTVRDRNQCAVSSQPVISQNFLVSPNCWGVGLRTVGLLLFFFRASWVLRRFFGNVKSLFSWHEDLVLNW